MVYGVNMRQKNNIEIVNFRAPVLDTELTILTYSMLEGLINPLIQHTSEKVVETLGLDPESQYYIEASLRTGTYLAAGVLVRGMRVVGAKQLYQKSALFRRFWKKTEDLQENLQDVIESCKDLVRVHDRTSTALLVLNQQLLQNPPLIFAYGIVTGVLLLDYTAQFSPLTAASITAGTSVFIQEYVSYSYGLGIGLGSSLLYQLVSSNLFSSVIEKIYDTARYRIWGLSRFMIPEGHFGLNIPESAQQKFIDALEFTPVTDSDLKIMLLDQCSKAKRCVGFKVTVKNTNDSINIVANYNPRMTVLTFSEFSLLVKRMIRDVITLTDGKIVSENVTKGHASLGLSGMSYQHCLWQSVFALPNAKNYDINHLPNKRMYFTDNFLDVLSKASEKFCYYFDNPPRINEIGFAATEVIKPKFYPLYSKEFHPFNPALYASVPKMRGETIDHLKPYLQPIAPLTNKNFLSRRETLYIAQKAKEAGIKPQLLEAAICIGKWFNSFLRTSSYPSLPHLQASYITQILEQVYPGLQEAEYKILWTTFLGKKRIESGDLEKGKINPTVDFFLRLIEAESAYRSNQHSSKVPLFERYVEKVEASRLVEGRGL